MRWPLDTQCDRDARFLVRGLKGVHTVCDGHTVFAIVILTGSGSGDPNDLDQVLVRPLR